MNRKRLSLYLLAACLWLAGAPNATAGWVWSPETGWIGPGGAVKDTPEEQLAFAMGFYERKDYDKAKKEFKKLLKTYKDSHQAAEAQYYLGRSEEESGDYYKAFLEYRKTVQTYPSTHRFEEILEREYQLGNLFLSGRKRKVFGVAALLPARDKAIEIFKAIVQDGPFTDYGQLAQFKLGLAHLALRDFEEAVSAFEQLISNYPDSPLVDDARFQIAQASLKGTFKSDYDQSPTEMAAQELSAFLREHPESDLSAEAEERLEDLKDRQAEHEYEVGQFYEKRKRPDAARLHYETVLERFSDTDWAPKAAERLQLLQRN